MQAKTIAHEKTDNAKHDGLRMAPYEPGNKPRRHSAVAPGQSDLFNVRWRPQGFTHCILGIWRINRCRAGIVCDIPTCFKPRRIVRKLNMQSYQYADPKRREHDQRPGKTKGREEKIMRCGRPNDGAHTKGRCKHRQGLGALCTLCSRGNISLHCGGRSGAKPAV